MYGGIIRGVKIPTCIIPRPGRFVLDNRKPIGTPITTASRLAPNPIMTLFTSRCNLRAFDSKAIASPKEGASAAKMALVSNVPMGRMAVARRIIAATVVMLLG